jgi:pimeloyl-ACP methyl ester carboxylesterase
VRPPAPRLLALENLALVEYATFLAAAPFLALPRDGDDHPVLVVPGFTASDRSTQLLRAVLARRGYQVHGWNLGPNVGPHPYIVQGLQQRLASLRQQHRARVSIIGWSLGGIYARELARANPAAVRQVITLGSPFRFRAGDRGAASGLYDAVGPKAEPFPGRMTDEHLRPPLPVPSSSIYSRTDGVVRWHACIDSAGPERENIEVIGTHSGLGVNVAALAAICDRLAQPDGQWAPFRPPRTLRHLYPRPASWSRSGESPRVA